MSQVGWTVVRIVVLFVVSIDTRGYLPTLIYEMSQSRKGVSCTTEMVPVHYTADIYHAP